MQTKFSHLILETDPESLAWDPLDDTVRVKLDKRRYVSLSRDRRQLEEGKTEGAESADVPGNDDDLIMPGEEEMSLFDVHMPGALSLEELQAQVDLDHWRLVVRGHLVEFMVSIQRPFLLITRQLVIHGTDDSFTGAAGPCWMGRVGHQFAAVNQEDCSRAGSRVGSQSGEELGCCTVLIFLWLYLRNKSKLRCMGIATVYMLEDRSIATSSLVLVSNMIIARTAANGSPSL